MNKQVLQMKYHPAKKEVEFRRFQNGKEVVIRSDSKLKKYMNLKGKFVLQDYGNSFFDDIAKVFDGLKSIDIQVITTKMDYEDFEQMVEYYNTDPNKCKINSTLLAELPDMNSTFTRVEKYGEQAIGILEKHKLALFDIPLENSNIKLSAENFARQLNEEIKNIREKIDSLRDNRVSLCFTGVYSSGKSTLINALLGYRILPEDIKSETAKMFQISSPMEGEKIKIKFDVCNVCSEVVWNEDELCFEFSKGPAENAIKTEIQGVMNKVREDKFKQHDQIYKILSDLNNRHEVSSVISIEFPIALDNESVQFVIYDTPGTDSNYLAHQQVLSEALEKQSQSILIFVAKPDGLEGSGNNALLNYLKVAEMKNSKTSIDIGRSLFVINKADAQTADVRITLQQQEIKNEDDENFSIKLADKKLFFTSALYAYAAKAVSNEIATPNEKGIFEGGKYTLALEQNPMGYCYRQDRCATSQHATERLQQKCEDALKEAQAEGNSAKILEICSGIYALEREILVYGEKYASAVKAFAIIDSVDKALNKLTSRANSLKDSNRADVNEVEANIRELREALSKAIDEEYRKVAISENTPLSEETLKRLKLDSKTLKHSIVGNTRIYLDKELKGQFFGLGKVRVRDKHKEKIKNKIDNIMADFKKQFFTERKMLLEDNRNLFIQAVKESIMKNGKISESAKKYVLDIPVPNIEAIGEIQNLDEIYEKNRKKEKIFLFEKEYLNKDGYIKNLEENLAKVAGIMGDDYSKDYRKALETLLTQIKFEFKTNLEEYSINMKAMIEEKDIMMQLGEKVVHTAEALSICQRELNKIIWKELKND